MPARGANGSVVRPQTTDVNGRYLFDSLLPGSYIIQFGNLPSGFQLTTQGSGGGSDSNPSVSTGRTPLFTLTPGDPDLRPVGPGDPTTSASFINPTIDAGIFDPLVDGSVPTTTVTPTTRPLPALPSTGSDVGHIALIALLALLAGVAFVVASRRRGSTAR